MIKRVKAAHQRLNCASIFTGSYLRSAAHFTAFKLNKKATVRGRLGGIPFYFRSADVEALKEVLVDREYSFLGELLRLHDAPKILDIGHHIGTFSLWAFCQNPKARILGVEADPDTFAVAEKTLGSAAQTALTGASSTAPHGRMTSPSLSPGAAMRWVIGLLKQAN